MKVQVVQLQFAANRLRQGLRPGRGLDADRLGQQLVDPAHAAGGALQLVPDLGQGADRAAADHCKDHELAQRAGAHLTGSNGVGTVPQHQHDGTEDQHDGGGGDQGLVLMRRRAVARAASRLMR